MAIVVDEKTKIMVQGITGREGGRATKQMLDYAGNVLCGVTPGKGGQEVEGAPVYDTVAEALEKHPEVNTSTIYIPPAGVKDAAFEALENGVKTLHIFTEKVPLADTAEIYALSKKLGAQVVGPSSIGIISPGKCKLGSIGGSVPDETFKPGNVGVISKSGGMVRELSWILVKDGIGQSTAVGMGGDMITGSAFTDYMELFEKDNETKALVIFGEHGGTYEEQAAEMIKSKKFTKPVIALIAGKFAENMPENVQLGHAGAIIEGGMGTTTSKIKKLEAAGAIIAAVPDDIPGLVKKALK